MKLKMHEGKQETYILTEKDYNMAEIPKHLLLSYNTERKHTRMKKANKNETEIQMS